MIENSIAFERFKRAYPKREGSNPWSHAEKKFNALVKSGVDAELIVRGAENFARVEAKNAGTRFIPMAVTWLNQQRFKDYEFKPESKAPALDWDNLVAFYKKTKIWARGVGPDPDSPACKAPREILLKHGLVF